MKVSKKMMRGLVHAKNSRVGHQILLFGAALTISQSAMAAQGTGAAALQNATTEFASYRDPVKKLMYAIAAVIVLVGAFNVYFKMQNGDQDVKKTIMLTVGGCVAFICMADFLPNFFNP